MKKVATAFLLLCYALGGHTTLPSVVAGYEQSATIGPVRGWLVLDGGGLPMEVRDRFVALAGGKEAEFVVIPTALRDAQIDSTKIRHSFSNYFGVTRVTVLHTRDRARANSEGFVEPIRRASGIWIDGGRQWRLADAYLGTAVEREIKALLARGGVVGGTSAGATIQASYLVRGDSGTPANQDGDNRIMMSEGHEIGFGLLANSAIDQHVNVRGREGDLAPVISKHPNLLGIGIDQGAAIVVHGDLFQVIGKGQVAIHDKQVHDGAQYYFLAAGQMFNVRTRSIEDKSKSFVQPVPKPNEESQDTKYPLTLTVTAATRYTTQWGIRTSGTGLLASRDDASKAPELIHIECDTGVFSRGNNGYPARMHKSHQLKIATREIGTDKLHESICKY